MDHIRELVDSLEERLATFGYNECAENGFGDVEFAAVLAAPRQSAGKLICAVTEMPEDVADADSAENFVSRVRRSLAKRYTRFPWPKRLGTYMVLLCPAEVCRRLRGREEMFIDSGGLHVNVMLGVVLVDVETYRFHSNTTWGLIDTGDQFRHIQDAVEQWCRRCRRPNRTAWTGGRKLSVA